MTDPHLLQALGRRKPAVRPVRLAAAALVLAAVLAATGCGNAAGGGKGGEDTTSSSADVLRAQPSGSRSPREGLQPWWLTIWGGTPSPALAPTAQNPERFT